MGTDVCLDPDPGGSKRISASTPSSCSHRWFRGEGGFTWSPCVESGQSALSPADLQPYNNNQNPPPNRGTHYAHKPPQICSAEPSLGGAVPGFRPHTARSSSHLARVTVGTWPRQSPAVWGIRFAGRRVQQVEASRFGFCVYPWLLLLGYHCFVPEQLSTVLASSWTVADFGLAAQKK